jgi:hypothetical protein
LFHWIWQLFFTIKSIKAPNVLSITLNLTCTYTIAYTHCSWIYIYLDKISTLSSLYSKKFIPVCVKCSCYNFKDKVRITNLILIHKNIRSVRNSHAQIYRSILRKTHYDITDNNNNVIYEGLDVALWVLCFFTSMQLNNWYNYITEILLIVPLNTYDHK